VTRSNTGATRPPAERIVFCGAEENRLVGDVVGAGGGDGDATALLLHGGGQTRHAWKTTADRLARAGVRAVSVDQRGHGDSQWVDSGRYSFFDFADDAALIAAAITERFGRPPVAVGASLGGIASLTAEARAGGLFEALILVDIVPQMDPAGVDRIETFMRARIDHGFGSLEEAAAAVAEYLPHRERPRSLAGLAKNLRLDPDGRYRWHWDPAFMDGPGGVGAGREAHIEEIDALSRQLRLPVLLVRGMLSDLVTDERVGTFLQRVPHAGVVEVGGAAHMVAGDQNDRFAEAILATFRPESAG
jgi:pimeloyl-ACP methyl ester carboxylesterase